jgi:hypothetical protein
VPFDNNAAEREVTMSELRIKVSGSVRVLPIHRRQTRHRHARCPPPGRGRNLLDRSAPTSSRLKSWQGHLSSYTLCLGAAVTPGVGCGGSLVPSR